MSTDPDINRYFTQQVVGSPQVVSLGLSTSAKRLSRHGVLVDWAHHRMRLTRVAARTLLSEDTAVLLTQEPLPLLQLRPLRRRLVLGVWLVWSVLLALIVWSLAS